MKKAILFILLFTLLNISAVFAESYGDIDGDKNVTALDAAILLESILDGTTGELSDAAKVYDGETVSVNDVNCVLNKALNKGYRFPIEFKGRTVFDFSYPKYQELGDLQESVTLGDITINKTTKAVTFCNGYLYLFGGGNKDNTSVTFNVEKDCIIKVFSKSVSDEERTMELCDKNSNKIGEYVVGKDISINRINYSGGENAISIYSKAKGTFIYRIELLYDYKEIDANCVWVDNFYDLKTGITEMECNGGGTVYINTNYMPCEDTIYLNKENSNVKITAAAGYTPILDFTNYYKKYFGQIKSGSKPAFRILGSNYTIDGIIIEKAPGTGISMGSESCHNNLIQNCVMRYNNNSGLSITNGAKNNTVKYCDAYRNFDIIRAGGDADGFRSNTSAGGGNAFYNCRSFENSDDGWDNFALYEDVTYVDCVTWHNGDYNVFTGKYDYDNNRPLDKNMHLIQMFMEQDPNFEFNYNNRNYRYPQGEFINITKDYETIMTLSVEGLIQNWEGNPNGFKLGSGDSKHGPKVENTALRVMKNCIVFDHTGAGFDRNNSSVTLELENGIAFDNKFNYHIATTTLSKFINAISFDFTKRDNYDEGTIITTPSKERQAEIRKAVYEKVDYIVNKLYNNKIPGRVIFDVF